MEKSKNKRPLHLLEKKNSSSISSSTSSDSTTINNSNLNKKLRISGILSDDTTSDINPSVKVDHINNIKRAQSTMDLFGWVEYLEIENNINFGEHNWKLIFSYIPKTKIINNGKCVGEIISKIQQVDINYRSHIISLSLNEVSKLCLFISCNDKSIAKFGTFNFNKHYIIYNIQRIINLINNNLLPKKPLTPIYIQKK